MNDLAQKIKEVSELRGHFMLRSGKTSDRYFDKYQFESDPQLLDELTDALIPLIPKEAEVLAGLEMGAIPLVTLLGYKLQIPIAFIRKEAKKYGTCNYAEGADLLGKKVVLIEDIVSSGGAVIEALEKFKQDGISVIAILCVIDRNLGGREAVENYDIPFSSLFNQNDFE